MDPLSLIVTAMKAAAAVVGTKIVEDGYKKLKTAFVKRFGKESEVAQALKKVEERPSSEPRQDVLKEELKLIQLPPTDPLYDLAKELLALLNKEGNLSNNKYQAILQSSGANVLGSGAVGAGVQSKVLAATGPGSQVSYDDHSKTEHHVHYHKSTPTPTRQDHSRDWHTRYLQEIANATNILPWAPVTQTFGDPENHEPFRLSDVYTSLDTTDLRRVKSEEEFRDHVCRFSVDDRVSAQKTLNDNRCLLIMGDAGSGKSTFVKHVAYTLSQARLVKEQTSLLPNLEPWDHGPSLPLWIEIRSLAVGLDESNGDLDLVAKFFSALKRLLTSQRLQGIAEELARFMDQRNQPILVLLDGLDEVPAHQRKMIVEVVNRIAEYYRCHRFVVTCRPYAYLNQPWRLTGFHQVTLAPFTPTQISQFVQNWYDQHVCRKRLPFSQAESLRKRLQDATSSSHLKELAERPLLLTVMAQLHTYKGQLPDDRTQLYEGAIDLLLERWEAKSGEGGGIVSSLGMPGLKMNDLKDGLGEVAFHAHGQQAERELGEITEGDLLRDLKKYLDRDRGKALDFVDYVSQRAGLLISHKADAYKFPHLSFQEYLAAYHLVGHKNFPREPARLVREDMNRWREVFVLSCGVATKTGRLGPALLSVEELCSEPVAVAKIKGSFHWEYAQLAGEALLEIGLIAVQRDEPGQKLYKRIQDWLIVALKRDQELPTVQRAAAGRTLAKLGDPRKEVLNPILIAWRGVPVGPFLMGNDNKEYTIPYDYKISRFPMTNAQFQEFVKARGYEKAEFWPEAKKADVWLNGTVKGQYDNEPRTCPEDFGEPFNLPNHPVVGVTWYEALAFTRWLTEEMRKKGGLSEGVSIQLPNEPEWEKAARGRDGLKFPWGNEPDPTKANYGETGIDATSAVGCFPGGVSPYGMEDMSGNVWEWTRSMYGRYPYPSDEEGRMQRENPKSKERRVFRGGSFNGAVSGLRCASRSNFHPSGRYDSLGFRVVVSPFSGF